MRTKRSTYSAFGPFKAIRGHAVVGPSSDWPSRTVPLFFRYSFSSRALVLLCSVHPQYDRCMKGMREVCSSCASWVEDSWLYCMQCGTSRPLRLPVNLFATSRTTSIASVYEKDRNKPGLEPLAKERGTKRPSLVRRQTSDGIHQQLDRVSETRIFLLSISNNHTRCCWIVGYTVVVHQYLPLSTPQIAS